MIRNIHEKTTSTSQVDLKTISLIEVNEIGREIIYNKWCHTRFLNICLRIRRYSGSRRCIFGSYRSRYICSRRYISIFEDKHVLIEIGRYCSSDVTCYNIFVYCWASSGLFPRSKYSPWGHLNDTEGEWIWRRLLRC